MKKKKLIEIIIFIVLFSSIPFNYTTHKEQMKQPVDIYKTNNGMVESPLIYGLPRSSFPYVIDPVDSLSSQTNDIIRHVKSEEDYGKLVFKDIMSSPVVSVKLDDDLDEVGKLMFEKGYMSMPVVDDDGNFTGLITYFDYLGKIAQKVKEKLEKKKD